MISRRRVLQSFASFGLTGTAVSGYALAVEPMRTTVTRYHVRPAGWPAGLRLSIGIIADVHAGEPYMSAERIASISAETNSLKPDVILLLGDYAAGHKFVSKAVPADAWAEAFSVLRAPLGVHAVLGNHDWWDDRTAQREGKGPVIGRLALERRGIPVYENDAVRLKKAGRPFWLAGLGDQLALIASRRNAKSLGESADGNRRYLGSADVPELSDAARRMLGRRRIAGVDDLPGTLRKITDDAPVILMAHEPDIFVDVPGRVALTLSGHTHGGQVRFAGYSPVVPSRYRNRYAYGHVVDRAEGGGEKHLVVSGGLGCSIFPVRLGCPPEIVLVEVG